MGYSIIAQRKAIIHTKQENATIYSHFTKSISYGRKDELMRKTGGKLYSCWQKMMKAGIPRPVKHTGRNGC